MPARTPGAVARVAALCLGVTMVGLAATPLPAAEASPGAVQAADAGRHVAALAADALEGREAGSRGGRAAGAYVVEELRRLGLQPAGDAGTYYQPFGSMRNILALVPGDDPDCAHELVLVGAHYDHVGYGTPATSNGPTGFIHNGADDNASGVAGVLEIAEALVGGTTRPRRSVLLAFWDGEEKGLLGSWHFVRERPPPLAAMRPVFSVNLDMIGRLRGSRVEVYGIRSGLGLRRLLVDANRGPGLDLDFDWDIVDDSDHFPFLASAVPTVMLHTGLHDEYHRPGDDAHLVDPGGIAAVSEVALALLLAVADAEGGAPVFRAACREEGNAARAALEAALPIDPVAPKPRWGMSTRRDGGDPSAPVVVRVVPGTPLAEAGLLVGDRILAIDGVAVHDHDDLLARMAAAGDAVGISIDRRGRLVGLTVRGAGPPR